MARVAALVVLLGACRFDRSVPEGSLITCETSEVCPAGMLCDPSLGRCVAATSAVLRSPGAPCTEAAQCQQGICDTGVCCERECAANEVCNLAGKEGSCQPRPPGAACESVAQCPSGFCLSSAGAKFCCERACGLSEPCDLPGHEGYCTPRPAGSACRSGAECPSGVCAGQQEQFCCDRACKPEERCDLLGHEGVCTPRPLGDGCLADADCPTGFCTDGRCCDQRCAAPCQTCAGGTCAVAADNTDARDECGRCGACIGGYCGAAEANTDPKGDCGAGQVCGPSQTCGSPGGARCVADTDCAFGQCVFSKCMSVTTERIRVDPMVDAPVEVAMGHLAVSPAGEVAVQFYERLNSGEATAYLAVRRESGQWSLPAAQPFGIAGVRPFPAVWGQWTGLEYWNGRLYLAQFFDQWSGLVPSGLLGHLFSAAYQTGAAELIAPAALASLGVKLGVDAEHKLVAFHLEDYVMTGYRREVPAAGPPAWVEFDRLPYAASDCEMVGGRPTCVLGDDATTTLKVLTLGAADVLDQIPYPTGCVSAISVYANLVRLEAGEALLVSLICELELGDTANLKGTWRPWEPAGARWKEVDFSGADIDYYQGYKFVRGATMPAILGVKWRGTRSSATLNWVEPGGAVRTVTVYSAQAGEGITSFGGVADEQGFPAIVVGLGDVSYEQRLKLIRFHP